MIPEFPEFKSIELNHYDEVIKNTSRYPAYSDFNFTSMWSWNLVDEMALSYLNGNLVVRFTDYVTNEPFYSFIGDNLVDETCDELLKFSIGLGLKPRLGLIPEDVVKHINTDKFEIVESRNHFDYIYDIGDLRDYPGGNFAKKRNHVSGFLKKYPNAIAKTISLSNESVSKEVLELFNKWRDNKILKEQDSGLHDLAAMKRLLQGVKIFKLVSVGIFIEEKLVGLFISELIDGGYAVAHMMKADTSVDDGLYAFLMQENAKILSTLNCKYFNYEQDLGIENLRIAKTRFRPKFFLKKYNICYTQKDNL